MKDDIADVGWRWVTRIFFVALIALLVLCFFIGKGCADNLGMWEIDDALIFNATIHDATGIAQAADTNVYWRVYENETGTALLNGSMTRIDSSNFPGTYTESITLSAANGFEVGKQYTVAMKAGVDGVTGEHTHNFQVHQYSDYKATGFSTLTEDSNIGIDLDDVSGTLDAAEIGTDAITSDEVGATAVTEITSGLATETNVDANETKIDALNDLSSAQIAALIAAGTQDIAVLIAALNDLSPAQLAAATAELETLINALNDLSAAQVNAEVDTALADYDPPTDTEMDSQFTTTAGLIDSVSGDVWDVTLSGHLGAGTTGNALNAAGAAGDPWSTAIPGAYGAGSAGYILGNNLDAPVSGVPTVAELASATEETAARVWAVSGRELSTPNNYKATGFSTATDVNNARDDILAVSDEFGSGGGASAADVADAVWDEATSGHAAAGSFGALIDWIRDVMEGDVVTDTSGNYIVYTYLKDTTTALITKLLYDENDNPIADDTTPIAKQLESAP